MVGLVGGIGSGKSLAAQALAQQGAFVLDADAVGHALLQQRPSRDRLVERFGTEILVPDPGDGSLRPIDRAVLGGIVFEDPSARRDLERVLHPRMRRTFERAISRAVRKGQNRAVVLDAAILFEAGWDDLCDTVFFIDTPRAARLERLSAARGWDAAALATRERAQLPLDEKKKRSDLIIPNQGSAEELNASLGRAFARFLRSVRTSRA